MSRHRRERVEPGPSVVAQPQLELRAIALEHLLDARALSGVERLGGDEAGGEPDSRECGDDEIPKS